MNSCSISAGPPGTIAVVVVTVAIFGRKREKEHSHPNSSASKHAPAYYVDIHEIYPTPAYSSTTVYTYRASWNCIAIAIKTSCTRSERERASC